MEKSKKVVLVFEKPYTCMDCPCLGFLDGEPVCEDTGEVFSKSQAIMLNKNVEFRPSWCRLIDFPEYKFDWSKEDNYASGWNDVLDMIGGSRR